MSDIYQSRRGGHENTLMIIDLNSSKVVKLYLSKDFTRLFLSSFGSSHSYSSSDNANNNDKPVSNLIGHAIMLIQPSIVMNTGNNENDSTKCDLRIDNLSQMVLLGQVKNYGICQGIRRNGESCKIAIDLNQGNKCHYHKHMSYEDDMAILAASAKASSASKFVLIDHNVRINAECSESNSNNNSNVSSNINTSAMKNVLDNLIPLGNPKSIVINNITNSSTNTKDSDLANLLGIKPIQTNPSNNYQNSTTNTNNSNNNNNSKSILLSSSASLLSFASTLYINKLKEKEVKSATITSTLSGECGGSSSLIPQRQLSKIGQLGNNNSGSNNNILLSKSMGISKINRDETRMFGSVLIDAQALAKNEKLYQQSKIKQQENVSNQSSRSQSTIALKKQRLSNELDQLLAKKSTHAMEAEIEQMETEEKRLDKLAAREAVLLKKASTSSTISIKNGFYCQHCKISMENVHPQCRERHLSQIITMRLLKRFYECGNCNKKTFVLLQNNGRVVSEALTTPTRRCESCSSDRWYICGSNGSRINLGGNSSDRCHQQEDQKLILSASEWTSSKDIDSVNIRLGSLN